MRLPRLLLCLLLLPLCLLAQTGLAGPRSTQLFNFGWKFMAGDPNGAQALSFDDAAWRELDLPHDFQFEQPWDQSAGGARGFKAMSIGWYRKTFKAEPAWQGRRVWIEFEGIMLMGEVWVNGKSIGTSDYGYLGLAADITELLRYDADNVIAVRASTGEKGQSRWYTGGGLFRDVNLVVKDPVSIARNGLFVSTPRISTASADVAVQVELSGITGKRLDLRIEAKLFGPDGTLVATTTAPAPQGSKLGTVEVPLPLAKIAKPQLWSCEVPALYTAEVALLLDGKLVDRDTETFGIRTVEFSREFGFRLNGKKVFLQGISNHHDLGVLGAAVHDQAIERLFRRLKEFGFNHVRSSHNPYSKSFLHLADKHGILIVDELFDKWSETAWWPGRVPFSQLWYRAIPEWIKRDRNHPSVILWSLGNELQMREDTAGFPTGDWGVTTYRILDLLVKRYDNTRRTTVAMYPSRANAIAKRDPDFNSSFIPPELSLVTEVASYNYQYHAYAGYLAHAPDLIIYQSEAATKDLLQPFNAMDREHMVGLAYWGAVEYWGESDGWPKKGWNYSFFNHALEPHPQAYLIRSVFSEEPLVRIGVIDGNTEGREWNEIAVGRLPISSHWNRTPGSKQSLHTYTNADEVELLLNGKSLGTQRNLREDPVRRNLLSWADIPYGEGGTLTAIARTKGKEIARHSLETTGPAVALRVETENAAWRGDGMDLQYLRVYAIDAQGRVVPTDDDELGVEVSGAARLLAIDNGNHVGEELFRGSRIKLCKGFAMAILRSSRSPGEVSVKLSAGHLGTQSLKLHTHE